MDSIHLEGKDKWLLRNAAYIGNSEQIGGLFMWMPSQYNYLYTMQFMCYFEIPTAADPQWVP